MSDPKAHDPASTTSRPSDADPGCSRSSSNRTLSCEASAYYTNLVPSSLSSPFPPSSRGLFLGLTVPLRSCLYTCSSLPATGLGGRCPPVYSVLPSLLSPANVWLLWAQKCELSFELGFHVLSPT